MEIKNQSNIKSRIFSKERVRSQTSSIMIVPKKIKKSQNSQLQITLINEKLPLNYLIIAFQLLSNEWETLLNGYSIYRAFLDEKMNRDINFLISFNTTTKLTSNEEDKIISLVLPRLRNILDNLKEPFNNQKREIESLKNEIEERKEMLDKLTAIKKEQDLNIEQKIKMKLANLQNQITLNEELSNNLKKVSEQLSLDKNELLEENQSKEKKIEILEKSLVLSKKEWDSKIVNYVDKIKELKSELDNFEKVYLLEQDKTVKRINKLEEENKELQTKLKDAKKQLVNQEKIYSKDGVEFENRIKELLVELENKKKLNSEKLHTLNKDLKLSYEKLNLEKEMNEEKVSELKNKLEQLVLEKEELIKKINELEDIIETMTTNKTRITDSINRQEREKKEQCVFNDVELTEVENELKEAFFDCDLSSFNKKVSFNAKEYNNYINNVSFLKFRWQKTLATYELSKNKLFIDTFNPYIENVEEFLEDLTINTKNVFLNKEKIMIKSHDLNLLKAYNDLSSYLN
ncbi:hypothetical protein [Vagococcus fluvialis]|uniref:hypothetical protein n=1 Tax=Vagococcus fluvialis TaxID=2738 RepID=UPI0037BB8066